jgi:hypothetical protein
MRQSRDLMSLKIRAGNRESGLFKAAKMRSCVLLLVFLGLFASTAVSWASKAKDGDNVACPYMKQKYAEESGHKGLTACPLKDKCPLYAAVVHGEGDGSLDSLKTADVSWSLAAQSTIALFGGNGRMSPCQCLSVSARHSSRRATIR